MFEENIEKEIISENESLIEEKKGQDGKISVLPKTEGMT